MESMEHGGEKGRVGGRRKERGRRRRREGKEGGALPYYPSRRRQLEKIINARCHYFLVLRGPPGSRFCSLCFYAS